MTELDRSDAAPVAGCLREDRRSALEQEDLDEHEPSRGRSRGSKPKLDGPGGERQRAAGHPIDI
jgi:hypothetical protein